MDHRTDAGDWVYVAEEDGETVAYVNDKQLRATESVDLIVVVGLGGNDYISNTTDIPSMIMAGNGADRIWGGEGDDYIFGATVTTASKAMAAAT